MQRIKTNSPDPLTRAYRYYSILSILNNLGLQKRQLELISFMAVKGINTANNRKEFCTLYNSTENTIGNILTVLRRKGMVIKDGQKNKINPLILLPFDKDVELNLTI